MVEHHGSIVLRDSTLREGLDVPGVSFSIEERLAIVVALARVGVPEAEVVAPSRVAEDLVHARAMRSAGIPIRLSGLLYANDPGWRGEIESMRDSLNGVDLLMPLSGRREPRDEREKAARLEEALDSCRALSIEVGAGLPHATQVDPSLVIEVARRATNAGAVRVTLYDTNGGAEPFGVRELVRRVASEVNVPVFFHAHDDLGLATANAWAAVAGGASGLDVTVNGLGDRAGNASLEQLVVLLRLKGWRVGVDPAQLRDLSRLIEELSGVPVSRLAPIVGQHTFDHEPPAHREAPTEFEAFDPSLIGGERRLRGVSP